MQNLSGYHILVDKKFKIPLRSLTIYIVKLSHSLKGYSKTSLLNIFYKFRKFLVYSF